MSIQTIEIGGLRLRITSANGPSDDKEFELYKREFANLPAEYLNLLRLADGFTGVFGEASEYVVFHSIHEATEWNRTMNVPTNEPGFALVGGNGGVDGFFVSTTGDDRWMVLPLIDIGMSGVRLEDNFQSVKEFAEFLAHRYE